MELRPYQKEAIDAIRTSYGKGVYKQLLSMSTGLGKTCIFSSLPANLSDILPKQMLVLLHREELADQAIEKLRHFNPTLRIDKEMGQYKADPSLAQIVVASVQSLGRKNTLRLDKYNWENFDKFIVDEAHRSIAQSYMNVYEAAGLLTEGDTRLLLGTTATPQRADGMALARLYQKIVYSYGLREAIEQSWLSDIKGIKISTKVSLDGIKTVAGDYDQQELSNTVNTEQRNTLIVKSWLEQANNRHTLGFGVDIKHSQDLAYLFKQNGINAEAVWGNDPDREYKVKEYRKHGIDVLFNAQLLTEGFDLDTISCIILAAPTKSNVVFSQRIGRGTRLSPNKTECLILDFVDSSSKHSLVTLPTLLGLNASLDLKGTSLVGAIKLIEQAQEDYPHLDFNSLKDIDQLESYIEQVDFFSIKPVPEVEDNSELIWHRSADNGYILLLSKTDQIKITQNLLDKYELKGTIGGQKFKGERESLADIFSAADDLVYKYAPDVLKVVKRNQSWQSLNPTEAQMHQIRKWYKNKPLPPNLTRGAASIIIGRHLAKKG